MIETAAFDAITTVATVPAILAIVNLLKRAGMSDKLSPFIAILLGIGINVSVLYFGETEWFKAASQGLILGMSAAGVYDISVTAGAKKKEVVNVGPTSVYPQEETIIVSNEGDTPSV